MKPPGLKRAIGIPCYSDDNVLQEHKAKVAAIPSSHIFELYFEFQQSKNVNVSKDDVKEGSPLFAMESSLNVPKRNGNRYAFNSSWKLDNLVKLQAS